MPAIALKGMVRSTLLEAESFPAVTFPWSFIPGRLNPADGLSRGLEENASWFSGGGGLDLSSPRLVVPGVYLPCVRVG